jgi:hypothetical protein
MHEKHADTTHVDILLKFVGPAHPCNSPCVTTMLIPVHAAVKVKALIMTLSLLPAGSLGAPALKRSNPEPIPQEQGKSAGWPGSHLSPPACDDLIGSRHMLSYCLS